MALLLQSLGFDALSAERSPDIEPFQSQCRLAYTDDPLRLGHLRMFNSGKIPETRLR